MGQCKPACRVFGPIAAGRGTRKVPWCLETECPARGACRLWAVTELSFFIVRNQSLNRD